MRASAISASGTVPPCRPEWTGASSVRTSTSRMATPRSEVVSVGSPTRQLLPSAISTTSAAKRSGLASTYWPKVTRPVSSSPSITTLMPTGEAAPTARSEPACSAMPHLSSAVPRPYRRPPRSAGSNGGEVHAASSPAGWMS